MAVTSLTGLNCSNSQYRHSESFGVIIDFSKRSVASGPRRARVGIRVLDAFAAFTSVNLDIGRISNRSTHSNTNREGSRSLLCGTSLLSKLEFLEAGTPIARRVSIKRARTTSHCFIRAKSLALRCQESIAHPVSASH